MSEEVEKTELVGARIKDEEGYTGTVTALRGDEVIIDYDDEVWPASVPATTIDEIIDTPSCECDHEWIHVPGQMRCVTCGASRPPSDRESVRAGEAAQ